MLGILENFTKFSVGLTGGIGSGKTAVSDWFAAQGVSVIDTDVISHKLTAPNGAAIETIRKTLGNAFIDEKGALNRSYTREIVFNDEKTRQRLQAILHPLIYQSCLREAKEACGPYLMFVVPLLIESSEYRSLMDRILVVDAPDEIRIARVMQRSDLTRRQVQAIMSKQAPREAHLLIADHVIDNFSTKEALILQLAQRHADYLTAARQKIQDNSKY